MNVGPPPTYILKSTGKGIFRVTAMFFYFYALQKIYRNSCLFFADLLLYIISGP
jgi:hypothetical protein